MTTNASLATITTTDISPETLALLTHLGFSQTDVARKARQRELVALRERYTEVLAPVLTQLVADVPRTESAKSSWKGHSIDQVPFELDGKTYTAKIILSEKG